MHRSLDRLMKVLNMAGERHAASFYRKLRNDLRGAQKMDEFFAWVRVVYRVAAASSAVAGSRRQSRAYEEIRDAAERLLLIRFAVCFDPGESNDEVDSTSFAVPR